jgi:hypothetical protein
MKKNLGLHQATSFEKLIMKNVQTTDPFKITEILLQEVSRINTQIISAK